MLRRACVLLGIYVAPGIAREAVPRSTTLFGAPRVPEAMQGGNSAYRRRADHGM